MEVEWGDQELFVETLHNAQKLCIYEVSWLIDLFCNYLYNYIYIYIFFLGGGEPKVTYFSRRGDDICHIVSQGRGGGCQKLAKKLLHIYFVNGPKSNFRD